MSAQLQNLLESFNSLQTDIRTSLDQQTAEIKAHGQSTEETGKKIAALDKQFLEMKAELGERIENAENEIGRARLGGGDGPEAQTPGDVFAASDAYKELVKNNARNSAPVEMKSFFGPARPRADLATADYPSRGTRVPGVVAPADRAARVRDLLNIAPTTDGSIEYVEETGFTNAAATVAERALKPQSDLNFALRTAPVRTVAHWIPATRQVLADEGQLRNYIDTRLIYGLKIVEDAQILYGVGTGSDIQGLMTNAAVQRYYGGSAVAADPQHTMIDSVRMAMVLTEDAEYPSDGVVLNHRDWATIETLKGDDGHYLWVNVTLGGQKQLWRVPVVSTSAMNEGEFLVGAFGLAATLWDREDANVRVSESHADFFLRNQVVILAEERLALANYRPEAFVNGSFTATTPP